MPKNRLLEKRTWVSSTDRKGKFQFPKLLDLKLDWESKYIKHKGAVLIDLADVDDLEISRYEPLGAAQHYFHKMHTSYYELEDWRDWQIRLRTKSQKKNWLLMGSKESYEEEKRKAQEKLDELEEANPRTLSRKARVKKEKIKLKKRLEVIEEETFNNWVYWIWVSMLAHSKHKIIDEIVAKTEGKWRDTDRRKGKIQSRIHRRDFDMRHKMFISLIEGADQKRKKLKKVGSGKTLKGEGGLKFKGVRGPTTEIGSGSFSSVYKMNWKKKPVAVKRIKHDIDRGFYSQDGTKIAVKEARIHASLGNHEHIIKLLDVTATKNYLYLFMEKGITLEEECNKLPLNKRLPLAADILTGVSHMHSLGIYHLDLKPENILIVKDVAKIADFGCARSKADYKKYGDIYNAKENNPRDWLHVGSMGYVPRDGMPEKGADLEKRDAYAIGMIFLRCLLGPLCDYQFDPEKYGDYHIYQGERYVWSSKDAPESISDYLERNKKTLDKNGLGGLAELTSRMLETSSARLTVRSALKQFPNVVMKPWSKHRFSTMSQEITKI